jgi:hypothetical protein
MDRNGGAAETVLNLLTVLALLLAGGLIARDRVLPWIREHRQVDPGDRVPGGLLLRNLPTGDTVRLVDLSPLTFLVFLSTCPSCERATPAWREALRAAEPGPDRFAAISLGAGSGAVDWVAKELPGVRLLEPLDRSRFATRLGIGVVPTVIAIGDDGRLIERREGVLEPAEARALLHASPPRAPGTGE